MCTITKLVHLSLLFLLTCLLRIVLVFSDSQQLMDMIELFVRCIGVEPIAADIAKMALRNMYDQFLDEFDRQQIRSHHIASHPRGHGKTNGQYWSAYRN